MLQGARHSMSIRAAFSTCAIGAILLGLLAVAGVSAAPPQTRFPSDFPVASDARLAGDESSSRLIVDFDRKIAVRAFTLANPYRVVLDLPQVTFQFPLNAGEKG